MLVVMLLGSHLDAHKVELVVKDVLLDGPEERGHVCLALVVGQQCHVGVTGWHAGADRLQHVGAVQLHVGPPKHQDVGADLQTEERTRTNRPRWCN